MKTLTQLLTAFMMIQYSVTNAQMVLEYDIDAPNTEIALPLAGTVNVSVNWGDGSTPETFTTSGRKPHTFATTGIKTVTITGTLSAYGSHYTTIINMRLKKVLSWDGLGLTSLSYAFYGADRLIQVPTSLPNTVTDISGMFTYASTFNQPINSWNTAAVTNMSVMFYYARAFNQPINTWNTTAVTEMIDMFYGASSFNQPIGSWDITAVTNMSNMFLGTSLCTDNYDNLLNGWAPQAVKTGVYFHGGTSKHSSASVSARGALIDKGWTITDAGIGATEDAKCESTAIVDKLHSSSATVIYPNPVKDKLSIRFVTPTNEKFTCAVFNTVGHLLVEQEATIDSLDIELSNLPQGVYVLKIGFINSTVVNSFVKE